MKAILVLASFFASVTAFAASETTLKANTAPGSFFHGNSNGQRAHFSTNVLALAQGSGNAQIDFFVADRFSFGFSFATASEKREPVKKDGQLKGSKVSVDRSAYGLGPTYWVFGSDAKLNLLLSPMLAFGSKKDLIDVESQNGLAFKAAGLGRITTELTAQAGLVMTNLEDGDFRGNLFVGMGYLF